MHVGHLSRLALGCLLVAMLSGVGPAQSEPSVWTRETGPARSPAGYVEFCHSQPEECATHGVASSEPLTQGRWSQLVEANRLANLLIIPRSDMEQYRVEEVWALPGSYGDCEDYVLLKRKWLIAQGWATGAVLISVVFDEMGEGHAVLVARTSAGDFVLDNKTDEIRRWSETPYRFVKRQSVTNPARWVRIGPPGGQDVTTATPSGGANSLMRLLRGGIFGD